MESGAGREYDLVVIGTGNAGMAMVIEARHAGWKVAIADELPYGGTCAVKGCIPKKVLVGAAEVIDRAKAMQGKGISGALRIAWPDLIRFKRTFTDTVPAARENRFAKEGVDTYHGHARFLGRNTLLVGDTTLSSRFIGIATGAVPRRLDIPGEQFISISEDFLAMETIPDRIVFIGGGFISFELGYVAARAGADVTILHRGERPLGEFDPFLVDLLVDDLRASGIRILTGMAVTSIEKKDNILHVYAGTTENGVFDADMVMHGAGRVPNLTGLDLGNGGVSVDERGIETNQYLQSVSNPSVYVAGDANARGKALSPVATRDGTTAARNMIRGNTIAPDYTAVPGVVFVSPLLASVGLSEDEAVARGITPVVHRKETADWYSNRRIGNSRSGYIILTEQGSGRIIGAHLLGYNADEMINIFSLAIRHHLSLEDLKETLWAYPTAGYDINRIH
ncbi:MAG: NAD(P)/FAD-dependent oxidoreductase [Methanomicrobiales archaeon]|nr:NAD(P)/FAD-dependent oxidoreductase [Methanomicrobiales archaeon]